VLRGLQQGPDGVDEGSTVGAQFDHAFVDYLLEEFFASGEKLYENLAAVFSAGGAFDIRMGFHAIDELHGAVVAERKAIGKGTNGGLLPGGKSANGKQQEILLGLQAGVADGGVAFLQETADQVAKLGEGAILVGSDLVAHDIILSYNDTSGKASDASQ